MLDKKFFQALAAAGLLGLWPVQPARADSTDGHYRHQNAQHDQADHQSGHRRGGYQHRDGRDHVDRIPKQNQLSSRDRPLSPPLTKNHPVHKPVRQAHRDHRHYAFDRGWHVHAFVPVPLVDREPIVDVPAGLVVLSVDGQPFFYSAATGTFYQQLAQGFVPVEAPIGAVVCAIPPATSTAFLNGINYYVYAGVYYTATPEGYRVVQSAPVNGDMGIDT